MKLKWVTCVLLMLVTAVIQLPAQQAKTEREFFEEARAKAEKGDADAQNSLGVCYATGRGVAKDEPEAVKWYRKAAEQNLPDAQDWLGSFYLNGRGVAKDEAEAV